MLFSILKVCRHQSLVAPCRESLMRNEKFHLHSAEPDYPKFGRKQTETFQDKLSPLSQHKGTF